MKNTEETYTINLTGEELGLVLEALNESDITMEHITGDVVNIFTNVWANVYRQAKEAQYFEH